MILIDALGGFCLTVGGLFLLVGVVGIFIQSPRWVRNVIVGVVLLWIGCWCTGAVLDNMGNKKPFTFKIFNNITPTQGFNIIFI